MTDSDRHQLGPLLRRIQDGDRAALNDLFARLRPYLHAVVRQQLGDGHAAASDVVQSGLRRIHEHLDDLLADDPTVPHLLAWVKKIVRNRAIDEVRRKAGLPLEGALEVLPEPVSPEQAAARDGRALRVIAALSRLRDRQRQVVELHYFDRLRDEEIANRIGGSVAAIRVLRCRALKELRHHLEADHDAE